MAAVLFLPVHAHAISAQKAILLDAATGRVLYEKNADEQSLIASTTKIMTALVVCEQCNVLDRMRIPKEAVGIEGHHTGITAMRLCQPTAGSKQSGMSNVYPVKKTQGINCLVHRFT